jgi:uncharacterized protein (DUF1697 family)
MATYIAFLRAVNVGGRMFAKQAIIEASESAGCNDVATYINTGNVRVTSSLRSRAKLETALEAAYAGRAGFSVPTIVLTPAELSQVARDVGEVGATLLDAARHYVYLLKQEPTQARVRDLLDRCKPQDRIEVRGRAAHLLLGPGIKQGVVDPYGIEKRLGVVATNRNRNVITKLAELWC